MSRMVIVDGVEYYAKSKGKNKVVVMPYGWIFVGEDVSINDQLYVLQNASVVRKWNNGKGIGALADPQHKEDYTLDACHGNVVLPMCSVIMAMDCEW